jgi:hypothetical protein
MTDLHALITELANELDHNRQCLLDDRRVTHPLADKARAALAEPEPERLTVQEISNLPQHWKNYIAEDLDDEIVLDGRFFRADLQQLADSIPNNRSNSNA